jgi:hypothetical protein
MYSTMFKALAKAKDLPSPEKPAKQPLAENGAAHAAAEAAAGGHQPVEIHVATDEEKAEWGL